MIHIWIAFHPNWNAVRFCPRLGRLPIPVPSAPTLISFLSDTALSSTSSQAVSHPSALASCQASSLPSSISSVSGWCTGPTPDFCGFRGEGSPPLHPHVVALTILGLSPRLPPPRSYLVRPSTHSLSSSLTRIFGFHPSDPDSSSVNGNMMSCSHDNQHMNV